MNSVAHPTSDNFFKAETSLFWYRGYFMDPKVAVSFVDSILAEYNVKRIVVGHTIVNKNINFYYDKKVFGLDVNHHAGRHQAVLNTGEKWFRVNDKGESQQL